MTTSIKISLRVIALFLVAILVSKIPELYPNFFGDWLCQGTLERINDSHYEFKGCNHLNVWHDPQFHWGYQHFLFFLMGLSLAIIQIVDIVKIAQKD